MTIHRQPRPRALALAVAGAALLAAVLAGPSSAGGGAALVVRGIQHEAASCENGGYLMTGALEGCWWIDSFDLQKPDDMTSSHYMATGEEHFTGWIGSTYGTFYTRYRFTAKTDGPWPTSAEVHGRCHHPITGGDGAFSGISGEISFKDVVDVSPPYYPYWGAIRLPTSASASRLGTGVATTSSSATDSTTC